MPTFTLRYLLQKSFWLKIWAWCKVNWKFLVGLAIPIIVSIVMRRGRAAEIFAKGQEVKVKQLELELEAIDLQADLEAKAKADHANSIDKAAEERIRALEELEKEADRVRGMINSPTKATEALADKFKLKNLDKE